MPRSIWKCKVQNLTSLTLMEKIAVCIHQGVLGKNQFELAEMKARVDAAKYLVYKAGLKKQQAMNGAKVRYSVEAAEAKLIAARTASDVTRRCLQLFGGYGYTRDYPIERMMRDAKITEIYEGTSEVQMMVISGALLK